MIPRHSFVAPPVGANAAATASAGDERGEERPHTSLRNQKPESTAPASMKTSPPPAATDVTSTSLRRCPTREPSSPYVDFGVGRLRAGDELPAARPCDQLQHLGLDRNLDPLGEAALDRLLDDAVRSSRPRRSTPGCRRCAPVAPPVAASRAPPSGRRRRRHDDRRRPLGARLRRHGSRDRDGTSDRVGERRSLRTRAGAREHRAHAVEIVGRRRCQRRVIGERDHATCGSPSAARRRTAARRPARLRAASAASRLPPSSPRRRARARRSRPAS